MKDQPGPSGPRVTKTTLYLSLLVFILRHIALSIVFATLYSDNSDNSDNSFLLGHRKRETNSVKAVLVQSTVVQWVPEVKVSIQMVNSHLIIYTYDRQYRYSDDIQPPDHIVKNIHQKFTSLRRTAGRRKGIMKTQKHIPAEARSKCATVCMRFCQMKVLHNKNLY